MSEKPHPGITMHKLSFAGDFIGLVFAVGSSLIFILGFPTLWYFVAFAFALGVCIALLLRVVSRGREERNKPLSILAKPETGATPLSQDQDPRYDRTREPRLLQIHPMFSA